MPLHELHEWIQYFKIKEKQRAENKEMRALDRAERKSMGKPKKPGKVKLGGQVVKRNELG